MPVTAAQVFTTSDNRQFINDEAGANAHQASLDAKDQIETFVGQSEISERIRPGAIRNIMAWEAWKSQQVVPEAPLPVNDALVENEFQVDVSELTKVPEALPSSAIDALASAIEATPDPVTTRIKRKTTGHRPAAGK